MDSIHHKFVVRPTMIEVYRWDVIKTEANEIIAQRKNLPCCGYEDDRCELPCAAPATVTDIETGCTFCATHFHEAIL